MCYYGLGFGSSSWLWGVMGLIKILVVVAVIIWLVKLVTKNNYKFNNFSNKATDILHERYVNGEIDEEEYLHKKKILKS